MMKYFAYGMNTNYDGMKHRCPSAISLGRATLPDHKFRFADHADIVEQPGSFVEGLLWEITDECERSLDALEGYPFYYEKKYVTIWYQGQLETAMVYYMVPGHNDSPPSNFYLETVLEGYEEHGISAMQIIEAIDLVTGDN